MGCPGGLPGLGGDPWSSNWLTAGSDGLVVVALGWGLAFVAGLWLLPQMQAGRVGIAWWWGSCSGNAVGCVFFLMRWEVGL